MASIDREQILKFRGQSLYDRDGEKVGTIEEVYLDADTNEPAWAVLNAGLLGTKSLFVPLNKASESDGDLTVPYDKATIKDAPDVEASGQLTKQEEADLHAHYGIDESSGDVDG
jgi:sporulation protein YlmC with PRC-barrel domain